MISKSMTCKTIRTRCATWRSTAPPFCSSIMALNEKLNARIDQEVGDDDGRFWTRN